MRAELTKETAEDYVRGYYAIHEMGGPIEIEQVAFIKGFTAYQGGMIVDQQDDLVTIIVRQDGYAFRWDVWMDKSDPEDVRLYGEF